MALLIFEIPVIIGAIELSRIILLAPLFKVASPYFKTAKNDDGYTKYLAAATLYYLLANNFLFLPIYFLQIFIGSIIVCAILCKITPLWEILTTSFKFTEFDFSFSTYRTSNVKEINNDIAGDLIPSEQQLLYNNDMLIRNNERNQLLQLGILLSKDNKLSILKKSIKFNQNVQQNVQLDAIIMNASVLVKLTRLLSVTPQRSKPSQFQTYRKHRTRNMQFLPTYNNEKTTIPRQRLICDSQVLIDPSEIHVAPPGDLFLSEKINQLDKELVDLTEHESMTRSLIKQKKEIDVYEITKKIQGLISQIKRIDNQKQQYRAQAQENIISKDVTKLSIPAFTIKQENSKKFAVYVIMVQRLDASTGQAKAGWIVPRRYNEFSLLHQHLNKHHSEFTEKFEFPGKTLFNNLNNSLLESRRIQFENYLQGLLTEGAVCEDKEFLKFLSKGN